VKIYTKYEIENACDMPVLMQAIEEGFQLASAGKAIHAPVSFLNFESPKADVHIKSGAFLNGDMYVIKIASGFYGNPLQGLPSSNGAMLLFSQKTGELLAILHDEGRLTDIRTGLTGAIAAKYLAPPLVNKIGILGTGTQAKEQLRHLKYKDVLVWGRDPQKTAQFAKDFNVTAVSTIEEITDQCQLIVTTTPASKPLLFGHQIKPGTHITAVGADGKGKQELDSSVFECADLIVVDSLSQCTSYGDLSHAKNIDLSKVVELGNPIQREPHWITVADLTGTAISDLQVAKAILKALEAENYSDINL
jgi:ornithine cyclodeaminase